MKPTSKQDIAITLTPDQLEEIIQERVESVIALRTHIIEVPQDIDWDVVEQRVLDCIEQEFDWWYNFYDLSFEFRPRFWGAVSTAISDFRR